MVEAWGMGRSQEFCYEEAADGFRRRRLSDHREKEIDADVDAILAEARQRTHDLLNDNKETLEALAALLVEQRVLRQKDLKEFLTGRGYEIDWRDALTVKDAEGEVLSGPRAGDGEGGDAPAEDASAPSKETARG